MAIATMRGMRNLSKQYRIQANALPEITRELERVKAECQDITVNSRKMQIGPFCCAILARFLDMEPADQHAFVAEGARRVDGLLAGEDQRGEWVRPGPRPPGSNGGEPTADPRLTSPEPSRARPATPPPAPRRKRSG